MGRMQPKYIVLCLLLLLPFQMYAQNGSSEEVALSDESNLSINGTSNVNDFRCGLEQELSRDTLSFSYQFVQNRVLVDGNTLYLNVDEFDCGKRGINRDFRNTLKADQYPYIKISLKELFVTEGSSFPSEAMVDIEIAGVTREYLVPLTETARFENKVRVKGEKTLHITDFNLNPPSALFGLIKVNNELKIDFNLIISQNL